MPLQHKLQYLINQPVGVSLRNGQGVSGVLCGYDNNQIYIMEYMYHTQFATKHYSYYEIQDVLPFPVCSGSGPLY